MRTDSPDPALPAQGLVTHTHTPYSKAWPPPQARPFRILCNFSLTLMSDIADVLLIVESYLRRNS